MWIGFFVKQKTAYELRISDWSSDVCSSDLNGRSGVIGPDGDVISDIDPRTRDVLVEEVVLVHDSTPAMVVGPWLGRLSVAVAWGALGLGVQRNGGGRNKGAGPTWVPTPTGGRKGGAVKPEEEGRSTRLNYRNKGHNTFALFD